MKKEPNKRINYLVPFLFAIYIALFIVAQLSRQKSEIFIMN